MSANTELFLRGVELTTSGDVAGLIAIADEEIEIEPLRAATEGAFRGHEGIRKFFADTAESFDRFAPDYDEVRDLDEERVLAVGVIHIRGRGSGVETDVPTAVIAGFRNGRLFRFKDYGDRAAALTAAGLD